jgi:hypothetical protein
MLLDFFLQLSPVSLLSVSRDGLDLFRKFRHPIFRRAFYRRFFRRCSGLVHASLITLRRLADWPRKSPRADISIFRTNNFVRMHARVLRISRHVSHGRPRLKRSSGSHHWNSREILRDLVDENSPMPWSTPQNQFQRDPAERKTRGDRSHPY